MSSTDFFKTVSRLKFHAYLALGALGIDNTYSTIFYGIPKKWVDVVW